MKMKKVMCSLVLSLIFCGCSYAVSPQEMISQLLQCEKKATNDCQQTKKNYKAIQQMLLAQRFSPQAFGLTILQLQKAIVDLKKALKEETLPNQVNKKEHQLAEMENKLALALAVVRWMESPA